LHQPTWIFRFFINHPKETPPPQKGDPKSFGERKNVESRTWNCVKVRLTATSRSLRDFIFCPPKNPFLSSLHSSLSPPSSFLYFTVQPNHITQLSHSSLTVHFPNYRLSIRISPLLLLEFGFRERIRELKSVILDDLG